MGSKLTRNDRCGTLSEIIISLCLSSPAYIAQSDCRRHAAFLDDFSNFPLSLHDGKSKTRAVVKDMPIERVFQVLGPWVESSFSGASLPLYIRTSHFIRPIL